MSNKPTHDLTTIAGEGKSAQFTRIAAVWPTKDGQGFTGEIPAGITVTGRFAILPRKEKDEG
jgi:hypothetical protein